MTEGAPSAATPGRLRRLRLAARQRVRQRPRLYKIVRVLKYGPYRGFTDETERKALLRRAESENWRVLYLGSGGRRQPGMINLDVTAETGPDVVADGFALPFADHTFDAIFCDYVIEHVGDPERFLAAASRVLKPGGYWYLEVPFLQPHHADADFQRWTRDGFALALRRAGLLPVRSGMHLGPGFGLAWMLRDFLAVLLSLGYAPLRKGLAWVLGFALSPLLLTDLLFLRLPGADGMACGFYHVARRPP